MAPRDSSAACSIDLVICTYNNAALLNRTLEALYDLSIPAIVKWSILVVNNNCTDETSHIVEEHISKGILPLSTILESTQGLTPARVCGVQNTDAEWIAFIDDDCILGTSWMEEAQKFIVHHPACGMFGSRIKIAWEKDPPLYALQFPFAYAAKNHGNYAKRIKAVAGAGMVVKRESLEKSGWLKEQYLDDRIGNKLVSGGDMEIALRVGNESEVWYNPACTLQHIIPERRTTKKYLQRIVFGLGASRHNVASLEWNGSYFTWFLYAIAYSFGMLGMCITDAIASKRRSAGIKVAFSPWLGWYAAMCSMFSMERQKRKKLLGCINSKHKRNKDISN